MRLHFPSILFLPASSFSQHPLSPSILFLPASYPLADQFTGIHREAQSIIYAKKTQELNYDQGWKVGYGCNSRLVVSRSQAALAREHTRGAGLTLDYDENWHDEFTKNWPFEETTVLDTFGRIGAVQSTSLSPWMLLSDSHTRSRQPRIYQDVHKKFNQQGYGK